MAKRRPPAEPPEEHPYLLVPKEQFAAELDERMQLGEELADRAIGTQGELESARSDYYTWSEYNQELLKRRFTTHAIAKGYSDWFGVIGGGREYLPQEIEEFRDEVQTKVRRLQSIRERLPLIEVAATVTATATPPQERARGEAPQSIFIVHGQDEAAKFAVHGFIRQLTEIDPVILGDEPNRGRTLIEKFEEVGAAASYAIIILTGDDVGRLAKDEKAVLDPRARQNVVFEFGYFVGAVGRSHVAVLYEDGVTMPSDLDGIAYIPYDPGGGWKLLLAKELKAAGITVDGAKLV